MATRSREYVGLNKFDKHGNYVGDAPKAGHVAKGTKSSRSKTSRLQEQILEQEHLIHNLKNMVVHRKGGDLIKSDKSDFDKCLQNYIGSAITDEIQEALDGLTSQYNTNKNRVQQAEKRVKEAAKERPKKMCDRACGTSDDLNIILAASNGTPQRFLGELCFEIEWRILFHVFGQNTTLYGVSTRQIEAKIRECSTNFMTLQPDYEKRDTLQKRYEEVLAMLAEVGYKRQYHPSLTEHYITRFGHFSVDRMPELVLAPGRQTRQLLKDIFRLHYTKYKTDKVQMAEWTEVKVLIDSLLRLAEYDGKRLFSWADRRKVLEEQKNGKVFNSWQ